MSLLCHFFEARWWSYAWISFALPEAFARVLVEGQEAADYMQHLRLLWDAATFAESMEGVGHPSASGVVQLRRDLLVRLVNYTVAHETHGSSLLGATFDDH